MLAQGFVTFEESETMEKIGSRVLDCPSRGLASGLFSFSASPPFFGGVISSAVLALRLPFPCVGDRGAAVWRPGGGDFDSVGL